MLSIRKLSIVVEHGKPRLHFDDSSEIVLAIFKTNQNTNRDKMVFSKSFYC